MPRRKGWFGQLNEHFHTHPKGRAHEFAFWFGLAVVMGGFALYGWRATWVSTPIALVLAVIAIAFAGWAFLPQHRPPTPPPKIGSEKSKRKR